MNFTALKTTRKGTAGEAIARAYFIGKEYQPFAPDFDGPHLIDFLIWNPNRRTLTAVDVKTYARRFAAPQTGLDTADYKTYKAFEQDKGVKVYLMFVDAFEGAIYGAYLSDLGEPTAVSPGKVYFSLERVKLLDWLTPEDLATLAPIKEPERYRRVKPYFRNNAHHVTEC
jgi:hypothetical protein